MKRLFLILGGLVCVILIISAMYVAFTIGLSVYIAHSNQMQMKKYAAVQAAIERGEIKPPAPGQPWNLDAPLPPSAPPPPPPKLEPLFTDPDGYGNEDNWLATMVSREIAGMTFFAAQPGQPLPDFKVKAQVDPAKPQVQVDIEGHGSGGEARIAVDLTPAFAWDPEGYAPLATRLLAATPGAAPVPQAEMSDVLTHLLNITASELAFEDMRLSADLQQHPTSWQDHEGAALLLTAMALREGAGVFDDSRTFLSRATAHLAMAQALRGNQPAGWPGLIADAAVRTLAGRELDALAHLDTLSARSDCPDSARTWIAALRTRAKTDWREAAVTPTSPLLLKITWYRAIAADTYTDVANTRLKKIVPEPEEDPNAPSDPAKQNPETLIADWGRIAGASPYNDSADDHVKNAQYKLDLEFHELDQVLTIEHAAPFNLDNLASVFSDPETDSVMNDASGKPVIQVIGAATFKADALRHLFSDLPHPNVAPVGDSGTEDPAEMQNFVAKIDGLFKDVLGYDLVQAGQKQLMPDDKNKIYADLGAAKKTLPVWQAPYELALSAPGYDRVQTFYARAVPFGTVSNPGQRALYIETIGAVKYPLPDKAVLKQMKSLPVDEANKQILAYVAKFNALDRALDPKGPSVFVQGLLKLDPDNYPLATDHVPSDQFLKVAARFLDYNLVAIERIERLDDEHLSDADRETVLRKHAVFEPDWNFMLANVLRREGKDDEAATTDRKAIAEADNAIGVSNSVLPLVDYDLSHGQNDEALAVAKNAADVNSEIGLGTYVYALERLGRLDEAEAVAKQIFNNYQENSWLNTLHTRHKDHWPDEYKAALADAYPDGLVAATLGTFSGPPSRGNQITSASDQLRLAHLESGDIVVALDGYKIDSDKQYTFVRAASLDSKMDFIIWRDGKYLEVTGAVPDRRMFVDMRDYSPH